MSSCTSIREGAPSCDRARTHCFAIQLHIAGDDHGLVAKAEWIAKQVTGANRHFTPLDVGFQLAGVDTLAGELRSTSRRAPIATRWPRAAWAVG